MTAKKGIKLAKDQCGKQISAEEAKKAEGELSEADLEGVSGGAAYTRQEHVLGDASAESLPYVRKEGEGKKVLGRL